jgi:large subunit ribosomal protein L29
MKPGELRGRSADDLHKELEQLRRQLFELGFQWQAEQKPDISRRSKLKRDIARVLTVLREMELARPGSEQAAN